MFNNFTKGGPTIKPVQSQSCWRDTRPGPGAVTHGVYNPVLNVAPTKQSECFATPLPAPKKTRGTV
jgi:hypothetical protein